MIYKCCLLNDIQIPPEAFKNENFFKLYARDVGILTSLLNINYNEIYLDNAFIYKGNIVENRKQRLKAAMQGYPYEVYVGGLSMKPQEICDLLNHRINK